MTAAPTLITGVARVKAWAQASVYTLQGAARGRAVCRMRGVAIQSERWPGLKMRTYEQGYETRETHGHQASSEIAVRTFVDEYTPDPA
jgi:hypothetical protein